MKKRVFAVWTAVLLFVSMALPVAMATETRETTEETVSETTEETREHYSMEKSGTCGKNVTWKLDGHTLTISGSGEMDEGSPWEFYKSTIERVILQGDITVIGAEAFYGCSNLEYIDFGNALREIGAKAFYACTALEAIRLPESFRRFEAECFRDCDSLQVVYCDGPMPSFRPSCLYTNHTVQVLHSAEIPWPYEETSRLMSNFGGRVHVDVGSPEVLEDYWKDIDRTVPKQTEPPVPAQTEPPVTVPETTAPIVPETTIPVVPETTVPPVTQTVPAETVPEVTETTASATEETAVVPVLELNQEDFRSTEPVQEETRQEREKPVFDGWVWALIAAAGLTAILILVLLIRMIVHGGGRYSD